MTPTVSITNVGFKEWTIAIEALTAGRTILLLRKGGIREPDKSFQVKSSICLLFPTYEHQQPHLLKPEYASKITPVSQGWHPETLEIGCWAKITHVFQVTDQEKVDRLFPFHIWSETFIKDRLAWKGNQPLNLLLVRTHRLANPVTIPYKSEYGGCKSWLELDKSISLENSSSVMSDSEYDQQVNHISSLIKDK